MRDCYIKNPNKVGVYIGTISNISTSKYYIDNVTVRGTEDILLENTAAFKINGSDHHFVDCTVSNIPIGFSINGGACRFYRCHDWNAKDALIDNTIGFQINAGGCTFVDCYLDTLKIGFDINASAQFLLCDGFNNSQYGMTNEIYYKKNSPSTKVKIIGGEIRNNQGTIITDTTNVTFIAFN